MHTRTHTHSYIRTGQIEAALAAYTSAIKISPKGDDLYFNRGNAHQARGDHDRSKRASGRESVCERERATEREKQKEEEREERERERAATYISTVAIAPNAWRP